MYAAPSASRPEKPPPQPVSKASDIPLGGRMLLFDATP